MDTGTMTVAGNNWDIIGDILDAEIIDNEKKKKAMKQESYCGCGSSYITIDVAERNKRNGNKRLGTLPTKSDFFGYNYFENPKNFPDERDINAYFEGFEDYPPVMNDPNIYSFFGRNPLESNLANTDDKANVPAPNGLQKAGKALSGKINTSLLIIFIISAIVVILAFIPMTGRKKSA